MAKNKGGKKVLNDWQRFQHAHKGKGWTPAELKRSYEVERSMHEIKEKIYAASENPNEKKTLKNKVSNAKLKNELLDKFKSVKGVNQKEMKKMKKIKLDDILDDVFDTNNKQLALIPEVKKVKRVNKSGKPRKKPILLEPTQENYDRLTDQIAKLEISLQECKERRKEALIKAGNCRTESIEKSGALRKLKRLARRIKDKEIKDLLPKKVKSARKRKSYDFIEV